MKQDKLIDHLDDRFILLHNLTDDYVSGRITVSQYTVGRDLIGLNYPKAINELYGFALPWWERWLYRFAGWLTGDGKFWLSYVWGFIAGSFAVWLMSR